MLQTFSTLNEPFPCLYLGRVGLVEAGAINVVYIGTCCEEVGNKSFLLGYAPWSIPSKEAGASEFSPLLVGKEASLMHVFELIDRIAGNALAWMSTAITDSNTFEIDSFHVSFFIEIQDGSGQGGNIDSCIALSRDVEIVLLQVRELEEEQPHSQ